MCREQESVQRAAARAQALEVDQLDREATGLESKAVQLRQQLTNASHSASAEDVANLMLVSKTMGAKAVAHRALQQQRKRELEGQEVECGRMAGDIALMAQRAEHVLRASETQAQVRIPCCSSICVLSRVLAGSSPSAHVPPCCFCGFVMRVIGAGDD